jgi:zinc protease
MVLMTTETNAVMLKPNLYKTTLDNGLTSIVKEVPDGKVATVQIWVKAGSIYEDDNERGITHLIEHMIFKGTDTMGAGDVAAAIEEKGGQINAYTSYEYTVYHATLPARDWGTAMDVLSDAVLHSTFDAQELEREKKVVLEEVRMRNDRPQIKLFQSLISTAYAVHPYRLPVIGTVTSVSSFTRDDILAYIGKHYHPNNFTVVVVGAVHADEVINRVKNIFGGQKAQANGVDNLPVEPTQKTFRMFNLEEDVNQSQLAMAFPGSAFNDADTPVLDVISGILGQGETSRLYNQLRNKEGLVYHINASSFTPKYPGLLEITATLDKDKIKAAMQSILTELFKLKYVLVDQDELERVKYNQESDFIFNLEEVDGQARVLGSFDAQSGDPREDDYLAEVRAVSRADIKRVARKYFNGHSLTTGYLIPRGSGFTFSKVELSHIIKVAEQAAKDSAPTSLVPSYLSNVHRFKLANGMTLLVREDAQVPTVAIRAVFPGGLRGETLATNGAFAFISDLLPKGTTKLSYRDISLQLADMAGDISGFTGKNTFGLKGNFLSRFFAEGFGLMRDVLLTPAFDADEAEKIRPELLAALQQQEDSLPSLAFREFNKELFQSHPYGLNTAGSPEAISSLTVAELRQIYNEYARPDKMVLSVVGKVKAKDVLAVAERLFGSWKNGHDDQHQEDFLPPAPPEGAKIIDIPRDKEQSHIIIGFLGTTLKSKDRFAMEILDTVLSGQSGRLFMQLRDKQSLAYSLSAFSLNGLDTGSFGVYIGTSPDKKDEAIKSVWQELYKIRDVPVSPAELEKARNILIGHYELGLQTHGAQAMDMALDETYALGQDYGNEYIHELSMVTADQVMAAARKYIQPDHYVLVSVGAE